MSTRRDQAVGAALFLVFVLVGWAPYFWATATSGIHASLPVLLGGFFAILAAGFSYDAAENLFGEGKGIYATAVLLTFPPAAIVFSEPPLLSESSMMFIVAASTWFAARATKESSREALFFIVLLSAIACATFGAWPPALLSLLPLLILRARAGTSYRTLIIATGAALLGLAANKYLPFQLPNISERQPDVAVSAVESILLVAPWFALGVLALAAEKAWARAAFAGILLLTALHASLGGEWLGILGAGAPLIALGIASVVLRWFEAETEGRLRGWRWFSISLILILFSVVIARIANIDSVVFGRNYAIIGLLIAVIALVATIRDGRRWIFALHAAAGLFVGALWWYYRDNTLAETTESSFELAPWIIVAGVVVRAGLMLVYGRRMPRRLRAEGALHKFDPVVFRRFSNVRRKMWEGEPVDVTPKTPGHIQFAVFGDIAGSESPFAGRNSGYFAFQKLAKQIEARGAEFAVSTGDLAVKATHLSYRRLRKLLRKVVVPLLATPGNHDLVFQRKVRAQFFHALFGSDHGDVTVGPVRMILINNAWGSLSDEQILWIERTFAKDSASAVTLVFCHKPIFDPRADTYYGMEHRPHAELLHDLFVKHHVTAVFSGHIHSLLHTERDGVQYIISGGGGSKLKSANDAHHFLWCEATRDHVRVSAHGLAAGEPLFDLKIETRR